MVFWFVSAEIASRPPLGTSGPRSPPAGVQLPAGCLQELGAGPRAGGGCLSCVVVVVVFVFFRRLLSHRSHGHG